MSQSEFRATMAAVMKWIAGILASLLIASVVFVASTLWAHEGQIKEMAATLPSISAQLTEIHRDIRAINEKLDEHIKETK